MVIHRNRFWVMVGLVGLSLILLTGGVLRFGVSPQAGAQHRCTPHDELTPEEREACARAKLERDQQGMRNGYGSLSPEEQAQVATLEALSPQERAATAELVPTAASTPPALGYIPAEAQKIAAIPPEQRADGPHRFRPSHAQSVWHIGAVSSTDQTFYFEIFAYTLRDSCTLGTTAFTQGLDPEIAKRYGHAWECPQDVGPLIITGATGPTGVISFTTASREPGTFDLTTEQWAFDIGTDIANE